MNKRNRENQLYNQIMRGLNDLINLGFTRYRAIEELGKRMNEYIKNHPK